MACISNHFNPATTATTTITAAAAAAAALAAAAATTAIYTAGWDATKIERNPSPSFLVWFCKVPAEVSVELQALPLHQIYPTIVACSFIIVYIVVELNVRPYVDVLAVNTSTQYQRQRGYFRLLSSFNSITR